jgi:hypothetical protein
MPRADAWLWGVAGQGSGSERRGLHGCRPACTQPLVIDTGSKQNACLHVPLDYSFVIHIMRCWVSLGSQLNYNCWVVIMSAWSERGDSCVTHSVYLWRCSLEKTFNYISTGATRDLYMACRTDGRTCMHVRDQMTRSMYI